MSAPAPFEIDVEALNALPAEERAVEMRRIAVLKKELEGNPLWSYIPHDADGTGGQVRYHEASAQDVYIAAIVAGNRFGKTHAGVVDNLIQILPPELLPPWLLPFKRRPYSGDYRCRTVVVDIPN